MVLQKLLSGADQKALAMAGAVGEDVVLGACRGCCKAREGLHGELAVEEELVVRMAYCELKAWSNWRDNCGRSAITVWHGPRAY